MAQVGRFQSVPKNVQALQWTGDNTADIRAFVGTKLRAITEIPQNGAGSVSLQTLTGNVTLNKGDYLVMSESGNFSSMKPFQFESGYVPVGMVPPPENGDNEEPEEPIGGEESPELPESGAE